MIESVDYLLALADANPRAATAAMHSALQRGIRPDQWIRDVVVPAQAHVGEQWFDGRWTISDEHAATAVAEQAVALLRPLVEPQSEALHVVFACAEGEWHTFPARLAAELTAHCGVHTVFIGANVPPEHLTQQLAAAAPDLLALSCTMSTNLIGAWRSITTAHELGIPVAVGGRAWGTTSLRANALGADAHLQDAADLIAVPLGSVAAPVSLPVESLALEVPAHDLLALTLERQTAATPWMQQMTEFRRRATFDDLGWLARHAAAAVAAGDSSIVGELLDWLAALLTPRGVPVATVLDSCYYLADALEPAAPLAAGILRAEADARHGRNRWT